MRTISLINQKGGVGKTTTAVNLGAALAEMGRRVCLIDLDPQAHLTINYGLDPSAARPGVYDVLLGDCPVADALHRISANVSLLPSSIDLAGAEVEMVSIIGREMLLRDRIAALDGAFDFILLDCPPSLGLLTLNALAAASEVIIPMQPHFLALQGVGKLLETVALVSRRINPRLKVTGMVLTMFDAQTRLSTEVVEDLASFIAAARGRPLPWADARIFATRIRRNIKLAECPSFGQTIFAYEPSSNGAADYRALAAEVLGAAEASSARPDETPADPPAHGTQTSPPAADPATPPQPPHAPAPTAIPAAAPAAISTVAPIPTAHPADAPRPAPPAPEAGPVRAVAAATAPAATERTAGPKPPASAARRDAARARPAHPARGRAAAATATKPAAGPSVAPPRSVAAAPPRPLPAQAPARAASSPQTPPRTSSPEAAPAKPVKSVVLVAIKSRPADGARMASSPAGAATAYRTGAAGSAAPSRGATAAAGAPASAANAR